MTCSEKKNGSGSASRNPKSANEGVKQSQRRKESKGEDVSAAAMAAGSKSAAMALDAKNVLVASLSIVLYLLFM